LQLQRLTPAQRVRLAEAVAGLDRRVAVAAVIEGKDANATPPSCPHCGSAEAGRPWGYASGLRRFRCVACHKTFNRLTGTELAGLRKKEQWIDYGAALRDRLTVRKAAESCGVHYTATFRWRHRFLAAPADVKPLLLQGIVEADETFFLESFKGRRSGLERSPRKRGGKAARRGLSREQIPVLVARDRAGTTTDAVLPGLSAKHIGRLLGPIVPADAVLCSDGARAYRTFAKRTGIRHEAAPGHRTRGAFHLQSVNAYHSRLKEWMKPFHGVATAYLSNYLGWRRLIERCGTSLDASACLREAVGHTDSSNNAK
jgi:transposase-like protein